MARRVFGGAGIDLDPCSCTAANARARASIFYDVAADGLSPASPWHGAVFVNPPFGMRDGSSMQGLFFERAVREYRSRTARGGVRQVLLVLRAAVGSAWFDAIYAWPHCMLSERQAFVRGGVAGAATAAPHATINPHGTVVVYMGPHVARFCAAFGAVGRVPGHTAWSSRGPAPMGGRLA